MSTETVSTFPCVYSIYVHSVIHSVWCYREKPLAIYAFTTNKQAQKRLSASTSSGGFVVNDVMIHFSGMLFVCVCVHMCVCVCVRMCMCVCVCVYMRNRGKPYTELL